MSGLMPLPGVAAEPGASTAAQAPAFQTVRLAAYATTTGRIMAAASVLAPQVGRGRGAPASMCERTALAFQNKQPHPTCNNTHLSTHVHS